MQSLLIVSDRNKCYEPSILMEEAKPIICAYIEELLIVSKSRFKQYRVDNLQWQKAALND